MTFIPTREAGLARLTEFLPHAGRDYARLRNSDLGAGQHKHVSMLSPFLRRRLITEREVVEAVIDRHGLGESEKFVQEVFWRTYFKGWLEHRPHIWARYQAGVAAGLQVLAKDKAMRVQYEQALADQTGIECFDHWARELMETGYLHNHARMWFASIWIFTLRLPWALGADFFLRHLLDGDPASNTLSWRWVGGLHTKGKTYLARPDNIARFTDGRFPANEGLATYAEPLTEPEDLVPDSPLPQSVALPEAPFVLLVHEDDCHPESLLPKGLSPQGVIGGLATSGRSELGVDAKAAEFSHLAVGNTLNRMGHDADPFGGNWADPLMSACEKYGVKDIVTAYAPTGPSSQALAEAGPDLAQNGITLTQILRPWDSITWPYANRGFFKVKKKMSKILDALPDR